MKCISGPPRTVLTYSFNNHSFLFIFYRQQWKGVWQYFFLLSRKYTQLGWIKMRRCANTTQIPLLFLYFIIRTVNESKLNEKKWQSLNTESAARNTEGTLCFYLEHKYTVHSSLSILWMTSTLHITFPLILQILLPSSIGCMQVLFWASRELASVCVCVP